MLIPGVLRAVPTPAKPRSHFFNIGFLNCSSFSPSHGQSILKGFFKKIKGIIGRQARVAKHLKLAFSFPGLTLRPNHQSQAVFKLKQNVNSLFNSIMVTRHILNLEVADKSQLSNNQLFLVQSYTKLHYTAPWKTQNMSFDTV